MFYCQVDVKVIVPQHFLSHLPHQKCHFVGRSYITILCFISRSPICMIKHLLVIIMQHNPRIKILYIYFFYWEESGEESRGPGYHVKFQKIEKQTRNKNIQWVILSDNDLLLKGLHHPSMQGNQELTINFVLTLLLIIKILVWGV